MVMDRLRHVLDRRVARIRRVEPFVRRIVAGGLALVVGLWLVDLGLRGSLPWFSGVGLVAVGVLSLAWGIWSQVEV